MNYYDLSNPSIPPTRGYRLGLWRLRRQRIYRILIALAAILTYILMYLTPVSYTHLTLPTTPYV